MCKFHFVAHEWQHNIKHYLPFICYNHNSIPFSKQTNRGIKAMCSSIDNNVTPLNFNFSHNHVYRSLGDWVFNSSFVVCADLMEFIWWLYNPCIKAWPHIHWTLCDTVLLVFGFLEKSNWLKIQPETVNLTMIVALWSCISNNVRQLIVPL